MLHYKCSISAIILLGVFFITCKKTQSSLTPLASIKLVNAIVNSAAVKVNFTTKASKSGGQYYSQITSSVGYSGSGAYSVLGNYTVPVTIVQVSDTTNPIFQGALNLANGTVYSLYLAGMAGAVDTIMRKEAIPSFSDSSCGVRFINLSYNSTPIVITQTASPAVNEINAIGYKDISDFKNYPAVYANKTYSFQVRDAATGVLLYAYNLATPYFHCVTLAWIGQKGSVGVNAQQLVRTNNY